jgi:hypothetical protein
MEMRICDVHRVIDNDIALRECVYCSRCQAWICKDDINRWDRRGLAMIKMWGNKFGPSDKKTVSRGCGNCGKDKQ